MGVSNRSSVVRAVCIALGYYLTAWFSLLLAVQPEGISVFWPASGFFLGVLLLTDKRDWCWLVPLLAVADAAASFSCYSQKWVPAAYALTNASEALLGAWLLRRFVGDRITLDRIEQVLGVLLIPPLTSCVLSSTLGTWVTLASGVSADFWSVWRVWWVSATLGVLVVTPVLVSWPLLRTCRKRGGVACVVEAVLLVLAVACTGVAVFMVRPDRAFALVPLLCVPLPLMAWAALRFGVPGVALTSLVLSLIAVWGTVNGGGLLYAIEIPMEQRVLWLQGYIAVTVAPALLIAASVESLRRSTQRFRDLCDLLPQTVFECDIAGTLTFVNRKAYAFFGYSESDFQKGIHAVETLAPEERERAIANIGTALRGQTAGNEYTALRKDGSRFPIAIYSAPILSGGRPVGLRGIIIDISDRKQAELEHLRLNEMLHHAQKLESIGHLAGGIAHDFNNQLTGIHGLAELLHRKLEGKEEKRYAELILGAARRSADLTGQLLAFARKGKYQSVPVNLHRIISEITELLSRSIDKRISIRQTLLADPPVTQGEPTQIQNALLNLAINARDAMPSGGALAFATDVVQLDEAHCRGRGEMIPGRYVRIRVSDTGVGIPAELQTRIFEPFFTTKKATGGTGMGLSAVYGIAKNHKGAIEVESREGQGSTFTLFFPLLDSGEDEREVNSTGTPVRGNASVLVVDDEPLVLEFVSGALNGLGYRVETCGDGVAAVARYRTAWREIDLVLLDLVMPKSGGRETFLAMREINPAITAILLSGYGLDGQAQRILDDGVLAFIQKPVELDELSRKVAGVLATRQRIL